MFLVWRAVGFRLLFGGGFGCDEFGLCLWALGYSLVLGVLVVYVLLNCGWVAGLCLAVWLGFVVPKLFVRLCYDCSLGGVGTCCLILCMFIYSTVLFLLDCWFVLFIDWMFALGFVCLV